MWLYVAGAAAALAAGYAAVTGGKKKKDAKPAAPTQTGAVPLQTAPIQPAGIPQPRGMTSLPTVVPSAGLTQAARVLLTYLNTNTPGRGPIPAVQAFQTAYNMSGPSTTLKSDGVYGPKTQAALQATVGSAPVPGHFLSATVTVAPPVIPAATPVVGYDVTGAATVLANMTAKQSGSFFPKTSDKRVSTFQAAYNQTPGVLHLAVDGKYGPGSQAALQSVLNWMGTGMQAPDNPFGAPPKSIPTFPGSAGTQIDPSLAAIRANQSLNTGV